MEKDSSVIFVVDREWSRFKAKVLAPTTNDAQAEGVEGRHSDLPRCVTEQVFQTSAEVTRGSGGERQGQDPGRRYLPRDDNVRDSRGEDRRLARAWPGNDQQRAIFCHHRMSLGQTQSGKVK